MPPQYAFDVYAPDVDPDLAARLVRLTVGDQLTDGEFHPALTGYGSGWIEIHADHADAQFLQKRALVQFVRIDTDPERKIGCFWLEEGDFKALSRAEQAGRLVKFEGPGGLFILDRYVLGHSHYAPDQEHRGSFDIPDKWTWEDVPYGAILTRLIEEGQGHPHAPYAPLQIDFTRTRDSNDNLWDELADYQVEIGTAGSKILADFLRLGLVVQCTADLTIRAFREISDFGTDRTSAVFAAGKVRFAAGQNILSDLPKRIAGTQRRSFVLLRGRTGDYLTVDEDIDLNPLPSEPYGAFLKSDTTADVDALTKMGRLHLTRREKQSDQCKVRHLIGPGGVNGAQGYDPGPDGDYWLGDVVTVNTGSAEHDYANQAIEVAAIRYFLQGGNWVAEAELGAQYLSPAEQRFESVTSIIRNVGAPVRLCEADVQGESEVVLVAEQVYSAGGGATVTGTLPAGYDDGNHVAIAHGYYDGGLSGAGDGIPDPPAGWTAIGLGGFSGGAGSGVGQHGSFRVLQPGDDDIGSWASPITTVKLMIFAGMDTADPIGTIASGTEPSGQMSWNTLSPEKVDGTSRFLMIGVHESENISDNAVTGTQPVTALGSAHGGLAAYWLSDPAAAWAVHTINCTNDDRLETTYELRAAAAATTLRDGMEALVGLSTAIKRCDDSQLYSASGSDSPTVNDDRAHGFRKHTLWINEDGEAWHARDVTDGAADWVQLTAVAAGGAPDDAGYLVTAAHAGLTSEVVVGATPQGELGGTWGAPTVDASHSGSTHAATQAAAEATAAAALAGHTGDATDAHDASAVSYDPTGSGMAATDVQEAIDELDAAIGGGGHAEDHDHDGAPTQKLAQANTHESPDTDAAAGSLHHTIGAGATQAAAGNHSHAGGGGLTVEGQYRHSATQAIATATDTAVAFSDEISDAGAMHSTAGNTSRITVQAAQADKAIRIHAQISIVNVATFQWQMWIRKNGVTEMGKRVRAFGNSGGVSTMQIDETFPASEHVATDYYEIMVRQASGSNRDIGSGTADANNWVEVISG